MSQLPFVFDDIRVTANEREFGALVLTPASPMVIDTRRRDRLKEMPPLNEVDRAILDRVRGRGDDTPMLIMRAADDSGKRLWSFDPSFTDDEVEETGAELVRSLMPLYRRFLASGITLFVHADWGERELSPMRRGVARLSENLDPDEDGAVRRLDEWLLRNMLLYSSLSFRHVTEVLLPEHMRLLERRQQRVRQLLEAVPPGAID